jgi:hypothetical protein
MKKTIIICGLVAGVIVTSVMVAAMAGCFKNPEFEGSMLLGYSSMLVAFSMIFVGVKNARDKYSDGTISFGKAFKIGLMIALIASTIYVVVWMIDYYYFLPDFFDKYSAHIIAKMKSSGASLAEIQKKTVELQDSGKLYKNPIYCPMFTYLEILPVGLLVTLVAALILKRKPNVDNVVLTT